MLKTLYKKNKNGTYQQWTVRAENDQIISEYGQVDGKIQTASKTAKAKNVGKSNEVSAEEQAEKQALSMWKKKLDKGYAESIEEADNVPPRPMLAHRFDKRKDKIKWDRGHFVQPKLDGVRCLARWVDGKVKLFSRKNKEWVNLRHIAKVLERKLPKDVVFDGEIYRHGLTFQEISSLVKKDQIVVTAKRGKVSTRYLSYHVYDCFKVGLSDEPYKDRKSRLQVFGVPSTSLDIVHPVITLEVFSEAECMEAHTMFVKGGYEGAIFRISTGGYSVGYRSNNLLKIKAFQDEEFEITGYYEGVGRYEGAVTWICKLADGREFHCVPKGTMEQKREWFQNGEDYIGKMLKVKYFEKTDDGIPRFPVGVGIRLEQD